MMIYLKTKEAQHLVIGGTYSLRRLEDIHDYLDSIPEIEKF